MSRSLKAKGTGPRARLDGLRPLHDRFTEQRTSLLEGNVNGGEFWPWKPRRPAAAWRWPPTARSSTKPDSIRSGGCASSLAPGIAAALEKAGLRPGDVHCVAVTRGPGSFTGLRVGVATAKVFAYAVGADVLGLDTLEVIAAAAPPQVSSLWVAIDAQRGDVVAAPFRLRPRRLVRARGPGPAAGHGRLADGPAAGDGRHGPRVGARHAAAGRRYDAGGELLAAHSRQPGPAGVSPLCGRAPR